MKRILTLLAFVSLPAWGQTPVHITLEKGEFTWNFPTSQDGAVTNVTPVQKP